MLKQKSDFENLQTASKYFLRKLGARVTPQTINRFLITHPAFPSILSISEALSDLKIENMVVNIGSDRLHEVPFPAIAHFNKGHFVVIDDFANDQVTYFDPALGKITETIKNFENQWSGVLLMAELDENSGEEDFTLKKLQIPVIISILVAMLALGIINGVVHYKEGLSVWLPLLGLKIIGGIVSMMLILKDQGISNALIHKVCDSDNSQISCEQVLDSPAATLFGWLKMSDLGLIYFAGGCITLLVGTSSGNLLSSVFCLSILTILALPYTLFSVAYQAFVIKKWCVFCLVVQAIFWLEFAFSFTILRAGWNTFSLSGVSIVAIVFGAVIAFWIILKPNLRWKKEFIAQETKLNFFLKSEEIMQGVLSNAPLAQEANFSKKITLGNPENPVEITMVSNVACGPCAKKHEVLKGLLEELPETLQVNVVFTGEKEEEGKINKVSRHLIGLTQEYDHAESLKAMSYWYKHQDFQGLQKKYPLSADTLEKAKELHGEHASWIQQQKITGTPTVFVQNRELPLGFDLDNLKSYWRSLS